MTSETQFIISCKHCHQQIAVTDAHVGVEVKCPNCDKNVLVMPHMKAAKLESSINEQVRVFEQNELEMLRQNEVELTGLLASPTNKNRWEFALLAGLLANDIKLLEPITAAGTVRPHRQYRWRLFRKKPVQRFAKFINEKTNELFALEHQLNELFAHHIQNALYGDSVEEIIYFCDRFSGFVQGLATYYDSLVAQELPGEHPYPEIFLYLQTWVLHLVQMLGWLVKQLQGIAEAETVTLSTLDFQFSFVPHDLSALLNYSMHLPQVKALP